MVKKLLILLLLVSGQVTAAQECSDKGIWLQVLGSGGPELGDKRASTSYLIWQDGHARVMVDAGGGSSLNFEQSGARFNDLDVILLTHFHVDHSSALPVYIMAGFFSDRDRDLAIVGPTGNALMPGMTAFLEYLFGKDRGAYHYLSEYLDARQPSAYKLHPHDMDAKAKTPQTVYDAHGLKVMAVGVHHGPVPALAYRVELGGKVLAFSGDMNGDAHTLPTLARHADLLVAHNAIPENLGGVARRLHMPPSVIGKIAHDAGVRQLVLSHFMLRTLGREQQTSRWIRKNYPGPLFFARDMECFRP